jgi:Polyketide cyclase / dehydrase and lipid transport
MSLLALISWALVALVLLVLVIAAARPKRFRVEHHRLLPAAPEQVMALLQDFHRWTAWSPWEHIDTSMQRSYSGADSGVGAVYAWTGSGKAGAGRMEIREASATRLLIQIDFFKPFSAHNTVEFNLAVQGAGTQLDWAMYGPSPYVSRLMGLVFNMDKLIGGDFERGLANIQAALQSQAPAQP